MAVAKELGHLLPPDKGGERGERNAEASALRVRVHRPEVRSAPLRAFEVPPLAHRISSKTQHPSNETGLFLIHAPTSAERECGRARPQWTPERR